MDKQFVLKTVFAPSEDIVVREIEGELIIVPVTASVANMDDELYTLNETGKAIWKKMDGRRDLACIIDELAGEFHADKDEVTMDVVGLVEELTRRKMFVAVGKN